VRIDVSEDHIAFIIGVRKIGREILKADIECSRHEIACGWIYMHLTMRTPGGEDRNYMSDRSRQRSKEAGWRIDYVVTCVCVYAVHCLIFDTVHVLHSSVVACQLLQSSD
jgi:exonuclease III